MRNYKIVILHNIISPYMTLLFNELYKLRNDIKVLYMAETESIREWDIKKEELKFPYEIMFKGILNNVNPLNLARQTWKSLNTLNPDVLIVGGYSYSSCWAGFFWAKKNKKKIILWSDSNEEDKDRLFLKEMIKSFFIKRCDAANVCGKRGKDYLIKLRMEPDKIFIKGIVTDNSFYYNETAKARNDRVALCKKFGVPDHNFLYIGRFSEGKNLIFLLDAYNRLNSNNWGLILVGDGPRRKESEDYIKKYAIKNVLMPGFKQKADIPMFLAVSDVFVLPSISEPWGLVVNEAMAAGLPVLVSKRCGCYPDLLKEGFNGFSFDPFDENELFSLMKEIVDGKVDLKKMGENSLEIISNYTLERAARIIVDTINFVLSEK